MKAVIYARYSCDNQRVESIEGQLRECTAFAEKNDITILKHYIGFVGKREEDGTSKIFNLDEFGARFDKRIRKAYLEGEYGGVPQLKDGKLIRKTEQTTS